MAIRVRVASTLTVLVLIAFALDLITVLSAPVTKTITLCEYEDYKFGVFGYCNTKTDECSSVGIGYDVSKVDNKFSLPSNARQSLARLLIFHVIAAGLTFILLVFSLLAHIHGPANSSRYILGVLVFSIPSFLATLLAFLVDILLFVSHLSWGGWIMLASTILSLAALIVLCIMRRTLSSQKAMKKRMEVQSELHDMNEFTNQPTHGFAGGAASGPGKSPDFSEIKYESNTSDDAVPLNDDPSTNRHQSFIFTDDNNNGNIGGNNNSESFTDHYQHAAYNAYRGGGRYNNHSNSLTNANEPAVQASTSLPTTQDSEIPQIPAGTDFDDEEEMAGRPQTNAANYGPNVVPIPKLRNDPSATSRRSGEQRRPSGPRAYRPTYQHPPLPQYPQQQHAEYHEPQQAQYYDPEYAYDDRYDPNTQQQEYEREPSPQQQYIAPRQQWQNRRPQQQAEPQYDHERDYQTSPPLPAQSPGAMSDGSSHYSHQQYYQQPPPMPPQHQYQPPPRPNRSEMVLESNPDFQVGPPTSRANRQRKPHQKPQSATGSNAVATPGTKQPGRKKPNMPAAFATSDSPYGISRTAGGGSLPPNL